MNPSLENAPDPNLSTDKKTDPIFLFMDSAMKQMPLFTLVAKDLTADILVDLWGDMQRFILQQQRDGVAIPAIRATLVERCSRVFVQDLANDELPPKISEAYQIAHAMRSWPTRKVAD